MVQSVSTSGVKSIFEVKSILPNIAQQGPSRAVMLLSNCYWKESMGLLRGAFPESKGSKFEYYRCSIKQWDA